MVVIAFNVEKHFAADRFPTRYLLALEPFDFERVEEALGDGVVVAASGSAHALLDAGLAQAIAKCLAGVLASTVRVEHETRWRLTLPQGHVESLDDDVRFQAE